jgi:hypothetical protein
MSELNSEILNWVLVAKGALLGHPFEGNQWTVNSNTSNPGGVSFGTATAIATKPSGGHAEAAAHLRSIATEAKKYDWNSPKTSKRLKTDVLGRQVNEHYNESKTGAVRRQNYGIGRVAQELAQKIEGDTSKPLSQHLAETHDQADQYRNDATFNSMVDNYDTARHFREAAQNLDDLADSVASNVNVAKGAPVGHPFEGNQWTSLGEKAKALGAVAKGLKSTSSPAEILAVAKMHRDIAGQHSVAAGQNEELPSLTSPDEIGRDRYNALRSESASEMGKHDAASYLHGKSANAFEIAASLRSGNPKASARALKAAQEISKQAVEASQKPTSHPVGDPEFAQHEENITNSDLAELGKAVFTKGGPLKPLPPRTDWRYWGQANAKKVLEQHTGSGSQVGHPFRGNQYTKSVGEIAKGDALGHPFHGNQYTGGNAGAHFDNFRPMDPQQTIAQIGKMNILGISGGRVNSLKNSHGETVGINLPVSRGYGVNVLLHPNDTYTVQRTFTRSGVTKIKGQEEGVHAEEIGDTAYRAGMYVNVPFGNHTP